MACEAIGAASSEAKGALHRRERPFDRRPDRRDRLVERLLPRAKRLVASSLLENKSLDAGGFQARSPGIVVIGIVVIDGVLIALNQDVARQGCREKTRWS